MQHSLKPTSTATAEAMPFVQSSLAADEIVVDDLRLLFGSHTDSHVLPNAQGFSGGAVFDNAVLAQTY